MVLHGNLFLISLLKPLIWYLQIKYAIFNKQLLDSVFVISRIIKVEVGVISRSRRLRLITLTETLIIPDITKNESNTELFYYTFNEKKMVTTVTVSGTDNLFVNV